MHAALVEVREGGVLARAALAGLRRDGLQALKSLGGVNLERGLRLLAIADDIDAKLRLRLDGLGDGLARAARQQGVVVGLMRHALEQQFRQIVGPRQAAGVRGDDAFAPLVVSRHVVLPLGFRDGEVLAEFSQRGKCFQQPE